MALKLWLSAGAFVALTTHLVFSSPELKAQVSFSDRFLSVVRLSVVCLSVVCRLSVCKLFTFLTSSPEPLDQF